jgi:hypothetical protein
MEAWMTEQIVAQIMGSRGRKTKTTTDGSRNRMKSKGARNAKQVVDESRKRCRTVKTSEVGVARHQDARSLNIRPSQLGKVAEEVK